jgi:hypothetical protein
VTTTGEITRTAALIAIGALDSESRSRLERAGLDWAKLQSLSKIPELPSPAETAEGAVPHELLASALRWFAAKNRAQDETSTSIGPRELAQAILASVIQDRDSGILPKRLVDSGLDFTNAMEYLEDTPEPTVIRSVTSIGDEPATADLLGRQDLVEALAAMLDHPWTTHPKNRSCSRPWPRPSTSTIHASSSGCATATVC